MGEDLGTAQARSVYMDESTYIDFFMEMERHVYLACVFLLQSNLKGVAIFDGTRQEEKVIWDKSAAGRFKLISRLRDFTDGGPAVVTLRCFTRRIDAETKNRIKNIYGWRVKKSGDQLSAEPIPEDELRKICSRDPVTGESLVIGAEIVFRVGKPVNI